MCQKRERYILKTLYHGAVNLILFIFSIYLVYLLYLIFIDYLLRSMNF
jgi:hypothetical protein